MIGFATAALSVCLIGPVLGGPVLYAGQVPVHVPVGAPAAVIPLPFLHTIRSQFHSQDELGQYSYGYSNEHSSKVETKDFNGLTSGGYSYIDANGLVQSVNYISDDENGFRVAASNLPVAPGAHGVHGAPVAPLPVLPPPAELPQIPQPVSDTPEVQKAKEEHEKAKAEAEKAAAGSSEESGEESNESTESGESGESGEETGTKPVEPEAASVSVTTPASHVPQADLRSSFPLDSSNIPANAIRSPFVPNPIFRSGPSYLPYYQGAFVPLGKREAHSRYPGFLVRFQPQNAGELGQYLSASRGAEGYSPERVDVDGNVLRER